MLLHNILLEIKNREVKGRREVREDFYNFFQDLRVKESHFFKNVHHTRGTWVAQLVKHLP